MSNLLSELEAVVGKIRAVTDPTAADDAATFIEERHAEIAAAARACGLYPNAEQTEAAYREYLSLNDGDEGKAKQDLGTLVMGWHAAMSAREGE